MKRFFLIFAGLIALVWSWYFIRRHIPSYMDYQGQKIKLSKYYLSFEDYKDDPDNIDQSENTRVARLVTDAPIDRQFVDPKEMVGAVFEIKFPGYGLGTIGDTVQPDGSALTMFSIEIPRADKDRYLTFRKYNGTYTLVDDFIGPDIPDFRKVRLEHGNLIYTSATGEQSLTRPIAKAP